jgi:hypothetical protein
MGRTGASTTTLSRVGYAGGGSWWFRSAIAAVAAGIAAKLGFNQSGDGDGLLPMSFTTVPGSR